MIDSSDAQLLLAALPVLSRRAPRPAGSNLSVTQPPPKNTDRHPDGVKTAAINYKELRDQHHLDRLEQLKAQPTSALNFDNLKPKPSNVDYRQLRSDQWSKRQLLLLNKTFLEAHPTKTFTAAQLRELLPNNWVLSRGNANFLPEVLKTPLQPNSPDFAIANLHFQAPIVAVERIENPYLWLMYQLKAQECKLLFGSDELYLFHGTSPNKIDLIARNNFDYRLAGTSTGHVHGKGVYFSNVSQVSKMYSRSGNCMLMARTQQGRVFPGNGELVIPPENYDTSGNGNILVKYYDHQFYPEFIVNY
jgi:Poly(ADP-ribose) polymerase catalytic domain